MTKANIIKIMIKILNNKVNKIKKYLKKIFK